MGLRVASVTHPGQSGKTNQDVVYAKSWILPDGEAGVIAVADGMGGHAHGETAARLAICELKMWCGAVFRRQNIDCDTVLQGLEGVFHSAHTKICTMNGGAEEKDRPGTTLTVCVWIDGECVVQNIGDTRCYIADESSIRQISIDDSWAAQQNSGSEKETAGSHAGQNLLTRCVGIGRFRRPHTARVKMRPGDMAVVCSDGFYKLLRQQEIVDVLNLWKKSNENPLETMLPLLFSRGEYDNISLALMME